MATHANKLTNSAPQATAGGAYFPISDPYISRAFEEWSAATIARTGNLPDPNEDLAHARYTLLCNADANTPGEAGLKLRVILHSLYVSAAHDQFPQQCAALATLVADLERQDAAARFAMRSDASQEFVSAWRVFTSYDEAVKALPQGATDDETALASGNCLDAFADLMHATPQTAGEAAAQLRAVLSERDDFLIAGSPVCDAVAAGLANVLAALDRLAAGGR